MQSLGSFSSRTCGHFMRCACLEGPKKKKVNRDENGDPASGCRNGEDPRFSFTSSAREPQSRRECLKSDQLRPRQLLGLTGPRRQSSRVGRYAGYC